MKVFKNHGASAGASMSHSHSQIIALPVIPSTASTRLNSMKEYHNQTGKCVLCNIHTNKLLIDESTHFISISPFASAFPFETWIVPRYHSSHYHELDEDKVLHLSSLLYFFGQMLFINAKMMDRAANEPNFQRTVCEPFGRKFVCVCLFYK
ncbi:putative HIT-like superfamily protein [Helianthus annuus]|nr:putative HIT-like superfamily protein [Helianthus annuus]